ncbi:MAG: DUF4363 family protein [Oscillospiraceae bacterium]|nr:DUF4363 family protein [Oscillospiraceae bacterium]
MSSIFKSTRTGIAAVLLAGITLLSVRSAFAVRRSCRRLLACTEAIQAETADAADKIEALEACWRRECRLLHFFVPNQPLTDLNAAILRLDALNSGQSDELSAALEAVRADLLWISGRELSVF